MRLNDSSSIGQHLKSHSLPTSKFRKNFVENTAMMAHEVNKIGLQIPEALQIKTNEKNRINRIY